MQRFSVRIWLPDQPGMLATVATCIASVGGDVTGLEVLERSGGVAIDEFVVELPRPESPDNLYHHLSTIPGVGIEEVRPLAAEAEERGLQVIAAAVAILETANASASLAALVGLTSDLFDVQWSALIDMGSETYVQCIGEVPALEWLTSFVSATRSAAPGVDTTGCGVMAGELEEIGLSLCIGRAVAFRRREQRELDMLVRVADRMCRPLRGDRIPTGWASQPRFLGS
jgi:hypothetical protein